MSKKKKIIILAIVIIGLALITLAIVLFSGKKEITIVTKIEVESHEYRSDIPTAVEYYIDSTEELNKFYELFSSEELKGKINEEYLKDNSIFIHFENESLYSTKLTIDKVIKNYNTVKLVINRHDSSGIQAQVAGSWYLMAIVPKEELKSLDLSKWTKPSTVNKQSKEIDITNEPGVIKYEIQDTEKQIVRFEERKFYISSIDQLKKFNLIYPNKLNLKEDDLKNNKIFVQVEETSSIDTKIKLSSIYILNSNVNFVVNMDDQMENQDDNSINWYLVAIIPNEIVENLELGEWSLPSDVNNIE